MLEGLRDASCTARLADTEALEQREASAPLRCRELFPLLAALAGPAAVADGPARYAGTAESLGHEAAGAGAEGRARWASETPLGRIGTPEDIGGAVLFLSSRAGAWLTGVTLPCDGGHSTRSA